MLSIRPRHRSTKDGLNTRMNPARQTISTEAEVSLVSSAASKPAFPAWARKSIASAATPTLRADDRPAAAGSSDRTSTISAEKSGDRAASIKALMLEPRPDMRTAVRTRGVTDEAFHGSKVYGPRLGQALRSGPGRGPRQPAHPALLSRCR